MKKSYSFQLISLALMTLFFMGFSGAAETKNDKNTIAVLPFKINAPEDFTYIQNGIVRMFDTRLSWPDAVTVIPKTTIRNYLADMDGVSENKKIGRIAKLTRSDFILTGSVTGIGGAFSIDAKIFDIRNKRYMSFFEQSKTIDTLIDKTDRIAASINKKVFDRTTVSWEKLEQEKQAYIKEQQRRNPEYMMQNPQWQETKESPGWRIWEYLF